MLLGSLERCTPRIPAAQNVIEWGVRTLPMRKADPADTLVT